MRPRPKSTSFLACAGRRILSECPIPADAAPAAIVATVAATAARWRAEIHVLRCTPIHSCSSPHEQIIQAGRFFFLGLFVPSTCACSLARTVPKVGHRINIARPPVTMNSTHTHPKIKKKRRRTPPNQPTDRATAEKKNRRTCAAYRIEYKYNSLFDEEQP